MKRLHKLKIPFIRNVTLISSEFRAKHAIVDEIKEWSKMAGKSKK